VPYCLSLASSVSWSKPASDAGHWTTVLCIIVCIRCIQRVSTFSATTTATRRQLKALVKWIQTWWWSGVVLRVAPVDTSVYASCLFACRPTWLSSPCPSVGKVPQRCVSGACHSVCPFVDGLDVYLSTCKLTICVNEWVSTSTSEICFCHTNERFQRRSSTLLQIMFTERDLILVRQ